MFYFLLVTLKDSLLSATVKLGHSWFLLKRLLYGYSVFTVDSESGRQTLDTPLQVPKPPLDTQVNKSPMAIKSDSSGKFLKIS